MTPNSILLSDSPDHLPKTSPTLAGGPRVVFCRTLFFVFTAVCTARAAATAEDSDFQQSAASFFVRHCLECHQTSNPSGNLDLTRREGLVSGGDSGAAVIPENASSSLLVQRIEAGEMPPPRHGVPQKLPSAEIEALKRWIDGGAIWPAGRKLDLYEMTSEFRGGRDWWSFQPLRAIEIPEQISADHPQHAIDAFITQKLEREHLRSAPMASARQRIRRLYIDLIGLPPTAEEIQEFESDPSVEAYQRLVDQLLASPHFGERWARHWLDVARFAETSGYERDQTKPFAWKYRDWVVGAFNQDLPYDQFVVRQLAGDEIPERDEDSVIATGFLRMGTWNDEPNDPEDYTYERLEDLVHATSSAFLALTVKCARCHDHKFDPIPQTDYYRMASVFWPGPIHARDRALLGGPSQAELGFDEVLGWTDIDRHPEPLYVLKNGERGHPVKPAAAGPLTAFGGATAPFLPNSEPQAKTTGLRYRLAQWIADEQNPLTARVIVNRLWQHHFGEGLVRSVDNFGFTGERPSHPDLLDWLAAELIRNGWKLKPLHRLMVTSRVYQQSSLHPEQNDYNQRDAGNRLLWRANRRRLDAESLRDAMLAASGELDPETGGPSFKPTISEDALEGLSRKASAWEASEESLQNRRSLYTFTQRSLLPPLMTTFDFCDTTLPCGQRNVTIVAPQALTLLNNEFVHKRVNTLAAVLLRQHTTSGARATAAWRAILKRDPDATETQLALDHVHRQYERIRNTDLQPEDETPEQLAWASLCLVLFNSNEFSWID